ncbi:MAG: YcjF family protein [Synechococcales cyanobacterium RM1_1_8]|nr:YcjF family protein [Synechococcales cyanobacterium RM1_1_8]
MREAEQRIAKQVLQARRGEAEALIRRYARNKAIAVGLNPIAILDMVGGAVSDLALIRALAQLYGLPMTSFQAGKLLQKILVSSGSLLLSELGSGLFFGIGKGIAVGGDLGAGLFGYGGVAIAQGPWRAMAPTWSGKPLSAT